MTHNRYLIYVFFAGLIAWLAFGLVIWRIDPYASTGLALALLFVSLFTALTCTFSVLGFYFRLWLFPNELFYKHVNVSLRQGVLLGLTAVFSLSLQVVRLLNWWSGMLVVFIFVLLEFYFSAKDAEIA